MSDAYTAADEEARVNDIIRTMNIMTDAAIDAALKQERLEIARMLRAEAAKHEDAAAELRADYDDADIREEAQAHESDAALLNRYADLIIARTPTAPEPEAYELDF